MKGGDKAISVLDRKKKGENEQQEPIRKPRKGKESSQAVAPLEKAKNERSLVHANLSNLTDTTLPPIVELFIFSTASSADSLLGNRTIPKPRDLPLESNTTSTLSISPHPANASFNCCQVQSHGRLWTTTCNPLLNPGCPGGGGLAPAQFFPPGKNPPRPRGYIGGG